ncbi:MAG: hypothetical protein HXO36_07365 [Prevotella sp.]|uniref:hypothetical protein n=1 Tax=Prevotella sp. TaxID=59823 RepID=UPI001CAB8453|nr:hypothetical protein [Prevotella sp.]MBF1614073.1 hypothetical protein [Prevotella sp.]
MVVIPIIEELSILYSATGNLPKGSDGYSVDDEDEEYEMDTPATPSVPAKHKSILS